LAWKLDNMHENMTVNGINRRNVKNCLQWEYKCITIVFIRRCYCVRTYLKNHTENLQR
jgi:hypothetical protein